MDYLTQHYKNLSEQLQAKVNHLNTLIRLSEENYIPDKEKMEKFSKLPEEEKRKYITPTYKNDSDKFDKKEYSPSKFKEDDPTLTDKEKYTLPLQSKPKTDEQPVTKKVLDDALSELAKRKAAQQTGKSTKQPTTDKSPPTRERDTINVDIA
jgi:hypothetical protein